MKELKIDIVPGLNCNFRCNYCYEEGKFKDETFTDETLYKTTQFIIKLYKHCKKIANDDILLHIFVFGGEPLLYLDKITYIIKVISNRLKEICPGIIVNITTNGSLIDDKLDEIFDLSEFCNLRMNISYDYFLQNITRMPGTYSLIRKNIVKLYDIKIPTRTITTFNINNLKYFYDTVKDYYELRNEYKEMKHSFLYNIDNGIISDNSLVLDEKSFKESLQQTSDYINENSLDRSKILYNTHCLDTGFSRNLYIAKIINNDMTVLKDIFDGSYFAGVLCAINYDGNIYTGMTALFSEAKDLLQLGTLDDNPETIINNRNNLIDISYNKNIATDCLKCIDCKANCKVYYWRTIKNNDLSTMHSMPTETWCRINEILMEYNLDGGNRMEKLNTN